MAGWNQGGLPQDFGLSGVGVAKAKAGPTWNELLRQTYALYRKSFKTLFTISLPPATCTYFCFFLQRIIVRGLGARGWVPNGMTAYFVFIFAVVLFEGAVYWIISGFYFAAIAANVLQDPESNELPVSRALNAARKRFGALAAVALLTWAVFTIGRTVFGYGVDLILKGLGLGLSKNPIVFEGGFLAVLLLLSGLISRVGLSIPALIDDPEVSVLQSLRLSLKKSENWEPFFMMFLAKTAVLAYAAYWLLNVRLSWFYQFALIRENSRFWIQSIVFICLAAVLEPPLFIAFSLLYRHSKVMKEEPQPAAAIG